MANIQIWPGSRSDFQQDADKVADFCTKRMGYPIVDVELQDINFYTAFEEAVTTYGNEVYAFKVRQDYLDVEGSSTGSALNNKLVTPHFGAIVRLSEQYGVEAGTGGNVTWRTGSLTLNAGVQDYDLAHFAADEGISEADLEVKRVFYESPPAIVKYFDPYAGTGTGMMNMMDNFGWGNYSPAINFMLMPINYDIAKIQAIELNDQVRKSNYSFELVNNKLRIFPIPLQACTLHLQYILKSDRFSSSLQSGDYVSNVSNVPYENPRYTLINSIGRSWIFEYTLAISKEMLGYVRGKYDSINIPEDKFRLNQDALLASATDDKNKLVEKLKSYLEETSREKLLERRAMESDHKHKELTRVPYVIYIG